MNDEKILKSLKEYDDHRLDVRGKIIAQSRDQATETAQMAIAIGVHKMARTDQRIMAMEKVAESNLDRMGAEAAATALGNLSAMSEAGFRNG